MPGAGSSSRSALNCRMMELREGEPSNVGCALSQGCATGVAEWLCPRPRQGHGLMFSASNAKHQGSSCRSDGRVEEFS